MKKARSFKKELIYSFLTIAFFSIAFLGAFQIYQLSSLIKENQKSQAQMTKYLSDYIGNYVLEHKKAIQTEALNVKEPFENRDIAGIQKQLKDIKTNFPGFVNMYVGNLEGQSIVFYPEVYTDGERRTNHNFSDRSYYKDLVKTRTTVISPVFHGRGGTDVLLVAIVSPILNDDGEMIGYVLGALDLNALGEHLSDRNFGEGGYTIVIDQEKNVVVSPYVDSRRELVNLAELEIVKYINKQQNGSGSRFFKVSAPPEDVYITFERVHPFDWTVWVSKPTSAITSTYKNAIILIIVFLLMTAILMVIASLFLTNRLEKTILHLLNYIKEYTKDSKVREPIKKQKQASREMEELYFHFNQMIDEVEKNRKGLMELNKELEGRVQERTAILKNKNSELKAVNKLITSVSSDRDLAHFIQHCLREIKPFTDYSIHVFFQDQAVTSEMIYTKQNLMDYLKTQMTGVQQHLEPIKIEKFYKGFLIVDLRSEQAIKASDREFLHTFAGSLAVMLQNKLLFETIGNKHAVLEAVLDSMSVGLMLVNNQKAVEYVNEFFLNVISLEYRMQVMLGTYDEAYENLELYNSEDVFNRIIKLFDVSKQDLQTFFTNKKGDIKLEYKQKSKKSKYYILHKFSVMLDDDVIGEGFMLRDITKEEEIDTLKNNLISLTSHEFKTPITNIMGSVETLLRAEVEWDPDFQKELLEGVYEDIERIQHLINDWMDISKIESGSMYVEREMISAEHVIQKSMEQVPLALRADAVLRFHNNLSRDFTFYADKVRVQQVLVNLFTNALRYNDAGVKEINIDLNMEPDYLTISVSDNGIGISKDHIEKIFNRFYQVDATATRRSGGTGLGLAICVGIMEAHEGRIEVVSEPGTGSTFTLYFPIIKGRE